MRYAHTQTSKWSLVLIFVVLLGLLALLLFLVQADDDGDTTIAAVIVGLSMLVVFASAVVFSRLTVTVDPTEVVAAFGWGWPRRNIAIGEIVSVQRVRNKWWYGWGLRWIPNGSMYNVWGFDAVELELRSGKVFRIGTDEPDALDTLFAAIGGADR